MSELQPDSIKISGESLINHITFATVEKPVGASGTVGACSYHRLAAILNRFSIWVRMMLCCQLQNCCLRWANLLQNAILRFCQTVSFLKKKKSDSSWKPGGQKPPFIQRGWLSLIENGFIKTKEACLAGYPQKISMWSVDYHWSASAYVLRPQRTLV